MHRVAQIFAVLLVLAMQPASPRLSAEDVAADFEALWRYVDENYAYFDDKQTMWSEVRKLYRPRLANVQTKGQLIAVLEAMMAELYDPHAHLNANTADSPPLLPSGTDLWAEWRDGKAIITDVREGSPSAKAGIRPMAEVLTIDGAPVLEAVESRIGRSLRGVDDQVRSWALRVALAGRRDAPRNLVIVQRGRRRSLQLLAAKRPDHQNQLLSSRILPDNVGYIRILDSLGNSELIGRFDAALAELKNTSGLVLDLRDTPGGGNTTVARGILGRFVTTELPYQRHVLVGEERATGIQRSWLELVSPRGPFSYRNPAVVLVNHWTGSMGEGLAMGFDATGAGKVVGTEMAGLLGATYQFELPRSGIGVNIPAERLSHIDGTPREKFRPEVHVSTEILGASSADPILEAGLRALRKNSAKALQDGPGRFSQ